MSTMNHLAPDQLRKGDPEFVGGHDDPSADMVLVSNDDKKFRVDSYLLKAFSTVFRDTLTVPLPATPSTSPAGSVAPNEISFDTTADDLNIFIQLMQGSQPSRKTSVAQWGRIADLAHKYGCDILLKVIRAELAAVSPRDPWEAFCVASRYEDFDLALKAVSEMEDVWPNFSESDSGKAVWITSPLQHITFEQYQACAPAYMYALTKAMSNVERDMAGLRGFREYPWETVSRYIRRYFPWKMGVVVCSPEDEDEGDSTDSEEM